MIRYSFIVMTFLGLILSVVAAPAQEACKLTVRNKSGSSIGRIDGDGTFRSRNGATIGRFRSGIVRNKSGTTIGRVDANGAVRDRSGATIGRVDDNGTLRNASGTQVGRIDPNGVVRNSSGASRGRFDSYVPACRRVCAAFLFFFEPLHQS